jgi:hypothetical protein
MRRSLWIFAGHRPPKIGSQLPGNMKITGYLSLAAASLLLAGCQTQPAYSGDSGHTDHDAYLATVKDELKTVDDKIASLADKSRGMTDDAKAQADTALAASRRERAVLGEKYDALMKSSADAWDSARAGFSDAWSQMQDSLANARAKFN